MDVAAQRGHSPGVPGTVHRGAAQTTSSAPDRLSRPETTRISSIQGPMAHYCLANRCIKNTVIRGALNCNEITVITAINFFGVSGEVSGGRHWAPNLAGTAPCQRQMCRSHAIYGPHTRFHSNPPPPSEFTRRPT